MRTDDGPACAGPPSSCCTTERLTGDINGTGIRSAGVPKNDARNDERGLWLLVVGIGGGVPSRGSGAFPLRGSGMNPPFSGRGGGVSSAVSRSVGGHGWDDDDEGKGEGRV